MLSPRVPCIGTPPEGCSRRGRRGLPGLLVRCLASAVLLFCPVTSFADPGDVAASAEALFQEGRRAMEAGDYGRAASLLAASQRMDPAPGTLLALALCHERQGRTASAWAEYLEAATLAKRSGQTEREAAARARAAELEPKLPRLRVRVTDPAAQMPGVELRRDGIPLDPAAWDVALPVDPGEHQLEITLPSRPPLLVRVSVPHESGEVVAELPPAPVQRGASPSREGLTPATATAADVAPARATPWRTAGWALVGTGLATLGGAGVAAAVAVAKNDDSAAYCEGNVCGPQGQDARGAARTAGDVATALSIVGGVVTVGGAGILLFAPKAPPHEARVGWAPVPGGGVFSFSGSL